MYRISSIISEVYNKYLSIAEKNHIQLNLDLGNNNEVIDNPTEIQESLEKHLSSALQRSKNHGSITISFKGHKIVVTDDGKVLSKAECSLLSKDGIIAKSRVGFGTSISINLEKPNDN